MLKLRICIIVQLRSETRAHAEVNLKFDEMPIQSQESSFFALGCKGRIWRRRPRAADSHVCGVSGCAVEEEKSLSNVIFFEIVSLPTCSLQKYTPELTVLPRSSSPLHSAALSLYREAA